MKWFRFVGYARSPEDGLWRQDVWFGDTKETIVRNSDGDIVKVERERKRKCRSDAGDAAVGKYPEAGSPSDDQHSSSTSHSEPAPSFAQSEAQAGQASPTKEEVVGNEKDGCVDRPAKTKPVPVVDQSNREGVVDVEKVSGGGGTNPRELPAILPPSAGS